MSHDLLPLTDLFDGQADLFGQSKLFGTPPVVPSTATAVFAEHFLDTLHVADSTGVTFSINAPTRDAVNPLFTTGTETDAWDRDKANPNVTKDADGWHMVYGGIDTSGNWAVCYATSVDGETWTKPNIGRVTYGGNTNNNIILGSVTPAHHFYDAPSAKWLLVVEPDINIYTSDTVDGVYTLVKTITPTAQGTATPEGKALVRRSDGRWVAYYVTGHSLNERGIYAYLSDTTAIDGTYVYSGRPLTSPASTAQYYTIATARIGDIIYASLSRYNSTTEQVDGDLFFSLDGLHFQPANTSWLPLGTGGAWDDEMVFPKSITEVGDSWHVYYGGSPANHAASLPRDSKIGRATIDRGRVGQATGTGSLTTRQVSVATGATMTVNADASAGTLDIEVQDASGTSLAGFAEADFDTISTDGFDHVPTWGGQPLPDNQTLRLKFVLSSATLYGYQMSDADPVPFPLDIDWHTAFWAEDPDWTKPAHTAAVSSWPNTGDGDFGDAAQGTGSKQPSYQTTYSTLNDKAALRSDGGDALATPAGTSIGQVNTVVLIARVYGDSGGTQMLTDGVVSGSRHSLFIASSKWFYFAGTSTDTGDAIDATGGHLHIVTFNGASSTYELDGVTIHSGNPGAHALTGLTLFNQFGQTFGSQSAIAFAGVIDGTLTAAEKADLLAWAQEYYGTP